MWKLSKSSKVLLNDSPEEEENRQQDSPPLSSPAATTSTQDMGHGFYVVEGSDLMGLPAQMVGKKNNPPDTSKNKDLSLQDEVTSSVSQLATKVQGAGFRGWKDVTSIFSKEDEQQLLTGCKSPKSKGTSSKSKEDVKLEKRTGFWDSLVTKQNIQSRKPDEIEGWEPPQISASDNLTNTGHTLYEYPSWSGWEDETKGSTKYTNLASSGNSSRWSIKSAGRLVSIRRQSKGNLTDNWEELE